MEASWCKEEFHHDRFGWKFLVYLSGVVLSLSLSFSISPTCCWSLLLICCFLSFSSFSFSSSLTHSLSLYLHPPPLPPPPSIFLHISCTLGQVRAGFTWMAIFKYRTPLHIEVSWIKGNGRLNGSLWIDLVEIFNLYSRLSIVCLGLIWKRLNVVWGENTYGGSYQLTFFFSFLWQESGHFRSLS